jgi:hypothetical protein
MWSEVSEDQATGVTPSLPRNPGLTRVGGGPESICRAREAAFVVQSGERARAAPPACLAQRVVT